MLIVTVFRIAFKSPVSTLLRYRSGPGFLLDTFLFTVLVIVYRDASDCDAVL